MTEEQFEALRALVTIAKGSSLKTASDLIDAVVRRGVKEEDALAAADFWRDHLQERFPDVDSLRRSQEAGPGGW